MTVSSPAAGRRIPMRAEFWRRRAIVLLSFITVASTPFLLAAEPTADAAPATPEPVRAVAARKEIPRIAAGPVASTIPRTTAPRRAATPEALLADPRLRLSDNARADLANNAIDPRMVALLTHLTRTYDLQVTVFSTGHGRYVKGTSKVSNHVYGRAVDIAAVNGEDVSSGNGVARRLLQELLGVDTEFRPTEIGGPWDIDDGEPVGFTDSGHRSHLHIGFDQ